MLLQKGAVNYCGCISRIEGAYIRIVGASAPTKRYKITPLSEEKINFGGRWVWLAESSPTQNFAVTALPWPHLCRPAAAASGRTQPKRGSNSVERTSAASGGREVWPGNSPNINLTKKYLGDPARQGQKMTPITTADEPVPVKQLKRVWRKGRRPLGARECTQR